MPCPNTKTDPVRWQNSHCTSVSNKDAMAKTKINKTEGRTEVGGVVSVDFTSSIFTENDGQG